MVQNTFKDSWKLSISGQTKYTVRAVYFYMYYTFATHHFRYSVCKVLKFFTNLKLMYCMIDVHTIGYLNNRYQWRNVVLVHL